MNNRAALRQARKAHKKLINESPFEFTINRLPLVDDGTGNLVENPYGTPTTSNVKGRISRYSGTQIKSQESPIGLSDDLIRYLIWEYDVDIQEGDRFVYTDLQTFVVDKPDALIKFGGIYGYRARLQEAS